MLYPVTVAEGSRHQAADHAHQRIHAHEQAGLRITYMEVVNQVANNGRQFEHADIGHDVGQAQEQ